MASHTWNSTVRGGYYTQGPDLTDEQKQEVADAEAEAGKAKLEEFGASVPNDLEGVIPNPDR
jgi:hypothetical protein